MIPPYQKPSAASTGKKKKKPGRKKGHAGSRRAKPERIDREVEHRLDQCPDCGGPLQQCKSKNSVRTRLIEDIPEQMEPEVTQHTIHLLHYRSQLGQPGSQGIISGRIQWHFGDGFLGGV